jgi:hypothetical protein
VWLNDLSLEPTEEDNTARREESQKGLPSRLPSFSPPSDNTPLLDFLAVDWESQLTRVFRQAVEARSGKTLKALALQPALWAECITSQLQSVRNNRGELTTLFALRAVSAWIESYTLEELLSGLNVDPARFNSLMGRLAAPHWPAPRVDPDTSARIIAVGKSLWSVVAPPGKTRGGPLLVPLDWEGRDDKIVVLRAVQGLSQGWRGFPGLPGQPGGN